MNQLRREFGMFVALALMCLGLWLSNSAFLEQANVINTTRQIGMLTIYSIGMAFVIITGGIDLSMGSVIGLTGVLIAKLSSPEEGCFGYSLWIGIPIALMVAVLIGLAQGLLITRLDLQPFIVTLGMMLLLRGVSQTIVQGGTLSFGSSTFPQLANSGLFTYHHKPVLIFPVLICVGVVLVATYVLHFTVFGRYVYAIGGNRDAAGYSGINVKNVETATYMISAGLAGVAGVCYAAYIGQMGSDVGIAYELFAVAAAVLGGCSLRGGEGTVIGVVIGSAVMKIIENGFDMFQIRYHGADNTQQTFRLDTNWKNIIIGAVILAAVILDQVVHFVQATRRTRKAGEAAPPPAPGGIAVIPAAGGA